MSRLFDDDEEVREFDFDLADDQALEVLISQLGAFQVTCKRGCGAFFMDEANILSMDESAGKAEFRCPVCNEIQTSDLIMEIE